MVLTSKIRKSLDEEISKPSEKSLGVTSERTFTLQEVSCHCDLLSCWIVLWNRVYDVTQFTRHHPGGEDIFLEHAGRDATGSFTDVGHSKDALALLGQYCIGDLAEDDCSGPRRVF